MNNFQNGLSSRSNSGIDGQFAHEPLDPQSVPCPPGLSSSADKTELPSGEVTAMDLYGIKALQSLIKMENTERTATSIGIDLNMCGIDMSREKSGMRISEHFASPWIETTRSEVEPSFDLPESFKIDNLPNPELKISTFNDETLFFIFYTRPKDIMQELAARELNARNWRYHKGIQLWLTKDSSSEPIQDETGTSERGVYIFFDPNSWERVKKQLLLQYNQIQAPIS